MSYESLRSILPPGMRTAFSDELLDRTGEIRLRLGQEVVLRTAGGVQTMPRKVIREDMNFCVNAASRYSPWNASTVKQGFLTAPGGHRVGVCGEGMDGCLREIRSLNIRVAKDIHGIADGIPIGDPILILGPPGSGKTTLLRDLIRRISRTATVSVVDERCEIFPQGFDPGLHTDVLAGFSKEQGTDMVLRSMGPEWIAVDEITYAGDCTALIRSGWCGVKLAATAHAASVKDLCSRPVYRPLVESGVFRLCVVLGRDRSFTVERICL